MKRKTLITLISVAVVALIVFSIIMGVTMNNQKEQIEQLTSVKILAAKDFEVGIFDTTTGKLDKEAENEYSLYSTGYYKVTDLKVELEKDTTLTYKVFFYDEDKAYLSCTGYLDKDYVEAEVSEPSGAKYVRLVVNTDETKVTATNKATILKEITVTVTK